MKAAHIVIAVLVLMALGTGRKYASVRKELEKQRGAMSEAWDQVDDVLSKHAAAVSSLLEGIKADLRTQPQIQQEIETACKMLVNGVPPEQKIQANARLNAAVARLLLFSETEPHAKSKQGFTYLESELTDAEGRIALPRRKYNEALEHYNAQIQQFPENVVASIAGLRRNDAYFKTEPGEVVPGK